MIQFPHRFARLLSLASPARLSVLAALGLLALLAGCASLSPEEQARRDRVLRDYEGALTALRSGDYIRAQSGLDAALLVVGANTAGDASARESRGYFNAESVKTFRGEPYERVMAYYYRAILYWMDGEPDNARAALRSAALQDANPETGKGECDWVLVDYLDGLATTKLGGDGQDARARAEAHARLNRPPPYDPQANVLVFIEMGRGPTKYAAGEYGEQLKFQPGSAPDSIAVLRTGGQTLRVGAFDDLSWQATTREGRVMDHILQGKAVFKGSTDAAGTAAIMAGAAVAMAGDSNASRNAGLGIALAGLVTKVVSAAATPAADTRQWSNLPNLLSFAALRLPPGDHEATIEFQSPDGQTVVTRQARFQVVNGRDTVLFLSDRNS
ncbi:MAG: hypothetical protein KIT22_11150 [Verrucomicrobiae bacterium]|nr:hypothetical protein [Verrucomicrobiae bacterium]